MADKQDGKPQHTAVERTLLDQILVGRVDAAFLLGVSPRTIDNLSYRGQLHPRRIGGRVLFLRTELEAYARKLGK